MAKNQTKKQQLFIVLNFSKVTKSRQLLSFVELIINIYITTCKEVLILRQHISTPPALFSDSTEAKLGLMEKTNKKNPDKDQRGLFQDRIFQREKNVCCRDPVCKMF